MLSADVETAKALQRLRRIAYSAEQPILFWLGAGISAWAGYPLWPELAQRFHAEYLRSVPQYDADAAHGFQRALDFPSLFSLCRSSDSGLYYRLLEETLSATRRKGPVHRRLCRIFDGFQPLRVVTTNIDESLENSLSNIRVIQRSDLPRALKLLHRNESFLCKLHGSLSSLESVVLTSEDYSEMVSDSAYMEMMRSLFSVSTVIFIGYSLADRYVLENVGRSDESMSIMGGGPHFLVTSSDSEDRRLPRPIQTIRYLAKPHEDHRSSLQVIDILRSEMRSADERESPAVVEDPIFDERKVSRREQVRSRYFLADIYPPGRWTTSQELEVVGEDGSERNILVGQGFVDVELVKKVSQGLHDLAVGLLCFDEVCVPFAAVDRVYHLLGEERFWRLISDGAVRFVRLPAQPAIVFPGRLDVAGGDLCVVAVGGSDGRTKERRIEEEIEAFLTALGYNLLETHAESLLRATVTVRQPDEDLPMMARAALLDPRLQKLIGLSDAIPPTSLPRWLAFPALRVLHAVQAVDACRIVGISALKIPFGGERLVTAVVGAGQARYRADEVAAYVVTQRATADIGSVIESAPHFMEAILSFRSTAAGERLRREVAQALDIPEGSEIEAAVSGGLRRALPAEVLESARDQLEDLMVPHGLPARPRSPAIWADKEYSDRAIRLWRRRARGDFELYCQKHDLGAYDPCPCGSGERLKFCCLSAVRE